MMDAEQTRELIFVVGSQVIAYWLGFLSGRRSRKEYRQDQPTPPPSSDPTINAGFGPDYPFKKDRGVRK